jgi:hypothetical protein
MLVQHQEAEQQKTQKLQIERQVLNEGVGSLQRTLNNFESALKKTLDKVYSFPLHHL